MNLPLTLEVTEQTIDISELNTQHIRYYQTLTKELTDRYNKLGQGRQIVTLSGPAGAGKSVVAAILTHIFKADSLFQFINVGLDAFHLTKEELESAGLTQVKGRYDTYDADGLYKKLEAFKAGESVLFPIYSRIEHNPIQNRLPTNNQNILILLEGQWLLRDDPKWERIRDLSFYNYEVRGAMDVMKENVIGRHIKGGRSREEAELFYTNNDLINTQEVLEKSVKPDEKIPFYKDI